MGGFHAEATLEECLRRGQPRQREFRPQLRGERVTTLQDQPGTCHPTPPTGPERLLASPHIEQSEPEFPTSLHRIAHRSATNPRFPRVFCQCCVPSGSTSQVVFAQHVTRPMKVGGVFVLREWRETGGDDEEIIARHLSGWSFSGLVTSSKKCTLAWIRC